MIDFFVTVLKLQIITLGYVSTFRGTIEDQGATSLEPGVFNFWFDIFNPYVCHVQTYVELHFGLYFSEFSKLPVVRYRKEWGFDSMRNVNEYLRKAGLELL